MSTTKTYIVGTTTAVVSGERKEKEVAAINNVHKVLTHKMVTQLEVMKI